MLKRIEDMNFYELLEVSPRATPQDIQRAYDRVRKIYDPNSIALYSLFSQEETAKIRQRIDEAYRTLSYEENRRQYDRMLRDRHEILEPEPPAPRFIPRPLSVPPSPPVERRAVVRPSAPVAEPPVPVRDQKAPSPFDGEFSGPTLRVLREQAGFTIRSIADITKIGSRHIEHLEQEEFAKLPARAYIRGFLHQYAKALGYDPNRVISDYMRRYDAVMGSPS
jgi:flagellar biosynthesis protein FlhG